MNPIKLIIKDLMKSAGFRCKNNTWYRQCNDLIQSLNIQKSAWGDQYYINLGFDYYDGSFIYPSEFKFHNSFDLIIRASTLFQDEDFKALDYNNDYDLEKRADTIRGIISKCLDFLGKCNSTTVLKNDYINICRNRLYVGPLRDVILGSGNKVE